MIGEVIDIQTHQSEWTLRWLMRFTMIVDNQHVYAHVNLEYSPGIKLLEYIADLWCPAPEKYKGKLFPMTQITFKNITFWSFDWIQMRRIVSDDKKRAKREAERLASE